MEKIVTPPEINSRSADSFAHALRVYFEFGKLDAVIDWCKENLRQEWRWQMVSFPNDRDPGEYIFYFDSDQDYFYFTCRWR